MGFPGGSVVKHLPASAGDDSSILGSPLEKEMTTHPRILVKIPWTEKPGRLQSMGPQRARPDAAVNSSDAFMLGMFISIAATTNYHKFGIYIYIYITEYA